MSAFFRFGLAIVSLLSFLKLSAELSTEVLFKLKFSALNSFLFCFSVETYLKDNFNLNNILYLKRKVIKFCRISVK
jgi:hypothetical protein